MTMYGGGVYRVPNALVEARSVFTNQVYGCACRGLGVPQAMFIIESQMDDLARRRKYGSCRITAKKHSA